MDLDTFLHLHLHGIALQRHERVIDVPVKATKGVAS